MDYLHRTISSAELLNVFMTLPPSLRDKRVEIIILPAENNDTKDNSKQKRQIGFAKGAEIPDCFFESLPEEELQAWGL